jgi:pSer/pThr/pTyr-binding forkhead associated (FHA) protein
VGRAPLADFRLGDPTVSGRHCKIKVDGAMATVEDLNSSNGTILEGERIGVRVLNKGVTMLLGHTQVWVHFVGEPETPPPCVPLKSSASDRLSQGTVTAAGQASAPPVGLPPGAGTRMVPPGPCEGTK